MDPPPPQISVSASNTLPSYLASLSPHTWYDYTSTPTLALELTPGNTPKPHKPKPPTHIVPSDILALATLLPSTRPLLLSQKFLKALDLTPEETTSLSKALKEQQPSSDKLGGGVVGKRKSKLEHLRERELQLAKEEEEEAIAEKKEVKRRREIDHALGLVGKGKGAWKRKEKVYGKIPEAATTTTAAAAVAATATTGDQGQQLQDEKEEEHDEAEQESAAQRKKWKIQELDRQLGLLPTGDNLPDEEALGTPSMPELVDIERTQLAHIDTDDAAAIRRAGIDVLLGLVVNNATPVDEPEPQSEKENDLISKVEVTRRRIDAEICLLNSARMAQMDAILGLLSPRKCDIIKD
ncbi:hypothetical protein EV426DRAFT_98943 [Tirmania nivea]|nr:hypothetical protein EV426DRAFT_98943 [Tirmania nivea]